MDLLQSSTHEVIKSRSYSNKAKTIKILGKFCISFLKKKKINKIDYLHSSSSVRTFETSKYFINQIKFGKIQYDDSLYHCSSSSLLNIIMNYSDDYQSVMVIAHNPGLTNLINNITNISLDNLPTTGLAEIEFNINSWSDISYENSNLVDLKFPKQLK